MTVAEAISVLKMVEAYGLADDAKKMAIRSLEAWEKVREEIERIGGSEEKSVYKCQHPSYVRGLEKSLEIIDKHLNWVTECK